MKLKSRKWETSEVTSCKRNEYHLLTRKIHKRKSKEIQNIISVCMSRMLTRRVQVKMPFIQNHNTKPPLLCPSPEQKALSFNNIKEKPSTHDINSCEV